jgi:hypothetical protein
MKISKQDADKFKDKVEGFVRTYTSEGGEVNEENFLVKLYEYAREQSTNYIPTREELAPNHRTGVNSTFLDFNMIMLSIISICWAVRMRKVKSEQGQCHAHTTNCNYTRKFHREIYQQWIDVVEEVLQALRSDPPSS